MSWSWKEEHEVKQYDTKGTVTISTDEYRDLLLEAAELRAAGQKEHDDWYKEYSRANALDTQVKDLTKKLDEIYAWFDSNDDVRTKFKLWKVERLESEETD